jgi:hypothetical protein
MLDLNGLEKYFLIAAGRNRIDIANGGIPFRQQYQ